MSGEICTCYESKVRERKRERDSEDVCGSWVRGEPYHVSAVNTGFTQDAPVQRRKKPAASAHTRKIHTPNTKKKKNAGIKSEIAEILKYSLNHIHYHGEIDFMRQNCLLAGRIQVYYTVQNVWGQQFFFLFFKKLLMLTKTFI